MEQVLSIAILFLASASVLLVMAMLRMFKGIAPPRGQPSARGRDHMRLGKLARSGARVPEDDAALVRQIVEQQLDTLERGEAARPLRLKGFGLFAVGIILFAAARDRDVLPLPTVLAVLGSLTLISTVFTNSMLRKYEATARTNGWLRQSD